MRSFIRFWQQDMINKLIVLVIVLILSAAGAQIYILTSTPGGKAFVAGFFPTPTMSVNELFRSGLATGTASAQQTASAVLPTITTMPFTLAPTLTASPTPTASAALPTPEPSQTPTPAATATITPEPSATGLAVSVGDCPPQGTPAPGKVLGIIDGYTVRVMIGELVYTVRYLGVELPQDENYARLTNTRNSELVFGKEVALVGDSVDRDDRNRLLRYVLVENQLVNLALIRDGLGTASAGSSPYACQAAFQAAEQDARAKLIGMWKPPEP